ncbi:hypothetical protein [Enterococcus italicus]|uniref:hypothetical protein n=1 Tax=Enterococcus italicus TaxID=246144 RepID=UPI003F45164F
MTNEKYKLLTDDTVDFFGRTLYRIEALKDFSNVLKGEKGGYIENENNLESFGDAWVYENAQVSGNARVYDDAWVYGNAWVFGNACVFGNARIYDNAQVFGNSWVLGDALVFGNTCIFENTCVYGKTLIYGNAQIYGNAHVKGDAQVNGDAQINGPLTLITISPIGSENGTLTAYKNNKGGISVNRGCFSGTLEEFKQSVKKTHGKNKHAKTYKLAIELIKSRLEE